MEDQIIRDYEDRIIETYLKSLYHTSKYLLGYKDVNIKTHGPIIQCLEDETKNKLIVCPRGAFKSSICVVSYSIWLLMRNPNLRILIDSELYINSKNFIREIKAHIETESFTSLFGVWKSDKNWAEGSITIAPRTRNFKESSITASGSSAVKVGQHFDVIIMDDMNSQKNSSTPEARQKIIDHYRRNIAILEPGGIVAVVGTRYSVGDLIGWVIDNEVGLNQHTIHKKFVGGIV